VVEEGEVGSRGSGANGTVLTPALLFMAIMTVGKELLFLASNFLFCKAGIIMVPIS